MKKAVEADEKKDYEFAQKVYLRSLEYIIPAIQCKLKIFEIFINYIWSFYRRNKLSKENRITGKSKSFFIIPNDFKIKN